MNCTDTYPYSDNACQGVDYEGYGFKIAAEDLPIFGKDSTYYRFAVNQKTGCDSTVALTITTRKAADVAPVYATICQGEVYNFGPYTLTEPNPAGVPYFIRGETQYGCDSTIYLYLTVNPSDTTDVDPIEITSDALPYRADEYYTIPENALPDDTKTITFDTLVKKEGCSFNRYSVTINRCEVSYGYAENLCEHQTTYQDDNFNIVAEEIPIPGGVSKQFNRTVRTATGCDSIITLTLSRSINDTTDVDVFIDNTQLPYEKDGFYTVPAETAVGADFYEVRNIGGCSYKRYHVMVTQCEVDYPFAERICEDADSYVGHGFTIPSADYPALPAPLQSMEYVRHALNAIGCDSVITLTLTAHNDTTDIVVSKVRTDLPYQVDDYYTVPIDAKIGEQFKVVKQRGESGCAYNRYIVMISDCANSITHTASICSVETSYSGYGFTIPSVEFGDLPAPGSSLQYYRNEANGATCDHITLTLSVIKNDTADINVTKFNTELPYQVDNIYTIPETTTVGSHEVVLPNGNDCGFNRYNITIEQKTQEFKKSDLICEDAESYTANGFNIPQSEMPAVGSYKTYERHGFALVAGVDSIVKLTLTVQANDTALVEDEIFNNELPYMVGNTVVIPADAAFGAHDVILANDAQCSYTRYLITVNQCTRPARVQDAICENANGYIGYGFNIAKADLPATLASKQYVRHETTTEGCDSIITLYLTVNALDTAEIAEEVLNTELPYIADDQTIVAKDAAIGVQPAVVLPTGKCDYKRYVITVKQCTDSIAYVDSICAGMDYAYYGFALKATEMPAAGQSKDFTRSNMNEEGCDSIITLSLMVLKSDTIVLEPVEINEDALPYTIEGYTIPAIKAGEYKGVYKMEGECAFYSYTLIVHEIGWGIVNINDDIDYIEVYDLLGRKIQTIRQGEDMKQSVPTGVYMLHTVMKSGQTINSKVAIQ
jgi:hypothetical protein